MKKVLLYCICWLSAGTAAAQAVDGITGADRGYEELLDGAAESVVRRELPAHTRGGHQGRVRLRHTQPNPYSATRYNNEPYVALSINYCGFFIL